MVTEAMPSGLRSRVPAKMTSSIRAPRRALGRLLAQHPADGVAQVGFSTAVGANDGRDARTGELHLGSVKEGLKALNLNSLEFQQSTVPFLLSISGDGSMVTA